MTLKTLAAATVLGLAAASAASAAPIFATGATIVQDGPRGTANNRNVLANALGAPDGSFFEIGTNAIVEFTFGQVFTGPASVLEVTFGSRGAFDEDTRLIGLLNGVQTVLAEFTNDDIGGDGAIAIAFTGIFDALRFQDFSQTGPDTGTLVDGIDIDSVSVSPIPVPAAGLLLVGALGALGLARRRAA